MGFIIYSVLIAFGFLTLRVIQPYTTIQLKDLYIGWGFKIFASAIFILIFSFYYSNGTIYGDAGNFLNDSLFLNEFAKTAPLEYLKLLFGFDIDESYFQSPPLSNTNIWSYGENGDLMNDNRLIIRINSIIHFISFQNVYVHGLTLSFLGLVGLIGIHQSFIPLIKNPQLFYYIILLFPPVLFWGSGITKEALLLFGLGLYFSGLVAVLKKKNFPSIVLLLIGTAILLLNKPYVGLIVIAMSSFLFLGKYFGFNKALRLAIPLILVLVTYSLTITPQPINLLEKISYKQRDLTNMGKGGVFFINDSAFCAFDYKYLDHFERQDEAKIKVLEDCEGEYKLFGESNFYPFKIKSDQRLYDLYLIQPPSSSFIETPLINYNRWAMVTSLPTVFLNTMVRPFPWDNGSNFKHVSFLCNIMLVGLLVFSLTNKRKLSNSEKFYNRFFIYTAIVIFIIIGWTTPILGAIVRYKMAAELLLIIGCFIPLKELNYEKK